MTLLNGFGGDKTPPLGRVCITGRISEKYRGFGGKLKRKGMKSKPIKSHKPPKYIV